jgi:uncharacterized membrane protein
MSNMKKYVFLLITITLFLSAIFSPVLAQSAKMDQVEKRIEAVVVSVRSEKELSDGGVKRKYQKLELLVTNTSQKGKKITVEHGLAPVVNTPEYNKGDKVSVSVTKDPEGKDAYFITDHIRRDTLYLLLAVFFVVSVIIGGLRGLRSIVGMGISFIIIFFVVLPLILKGFDPISVAILSSVVIIPVNFYLAHGINKKTTSAVLGTIIALVVTGILAQIFVSAGHLTGFTSDEASLLNTAKNGTVPMRGLLLAGIIIGALGVLDDITISQSSVVFQLRQTAEKLKFWQVFAKAMDVGRDHIASMVNTLVLVYTGAAMPLLLIFADNTKSFTEIINYEMIAEEIIRTLVVSIGLILAVPVVTLIATILSDRETKRAAKEIIHSLK